LRLPHDLTLWDHLLHNVLHGELLALLLLQLVVEHGWLLAVRRVVIVFGVCLLLRSFHNEDEEKLLFLLNRMEYSGYLFIT